MNSLLLIPFLFQLAAAPAGPPTPEEQRLFAEGLRAFDAGDARTAETIWKQGYAVHADPAFLVRIGEAQEKSGAARDAAESYRRYLREAPDAADRAEIEQRIARLQPAAPAAPATKTEQPAPPEKATTAPPAAAALPSPAAPPTAPQPTPAVDTEETPVRVGAAPGGWNAYNTTAWISVAATVVLLGTAGFFGAAAASKKDDVNRLITYRNQDTGAPLEYQAVAAQYLSATADGQHDDRVAKALLWTAAGTAAVAATFFIIDGVREAPAGGVAIAPAPSVGARAGGFAALGTWRWRF